MPGMSLICDFRGLDDSQAKIDAALEGIVHDGRYASRILERDRSRLLAFTGYPEYPFASYKLGDFTVYVEGRIYGGGAISLEARVRRLTELIAGESSPPEIESWLADTDGEFVVCVLDSRNGHIHIVADSFGRLPLYWYRSPSTFILSRELSFVARFVPSLRFDRMGIAQHLLIGYPLGSRTLVRDISRLQPAPYVRVKPDGADVQISQLHCFNFERDDGAGHSLRRNAQELADLFTQACAARSEPGRMNVVSMSGGFDSRAVAAGLHAAGEPFACATFLDHVGTAAADVDPAASVARLFGSNWTLLRLGPPQVADVLKLLRMKSGMNPLGMSFLLPFLQQVGEQWEFNLNFTTGEFGTFTLPEPAPPVEPNGLTGLVQFLILQGRRFPLALVERLTTLREADILDEILRHVSNYPESDLAQKLVHFVLYERAFKWHSEAEDRNRCFFWTTSPFISLPFFRFAMSCPRVQKRYYRLYREFLLRLSADAAAINHAVYGLPITSDKFELAARAASLLAQRPDAITQLAAAPETYSGESMVIRLMTMQLDSCPLLDEYLERSVLEQVVRQPRAQARDKVDLLFTVTSTIELLGTGRSVMESVAGDSQ